MSRVRVYHENQASWFNGVLQVAFIVLKLCKVIDWSWWWVWSPTLISLGLRAFLLLIVTIIR